MSKKSKEKIFLLIVLLVGTAFMGWQYREKGIVIDPINEAKVQYVNNVGIVRNEIDITQKKKAVDIQPESKE